MDFGLAFDECFGFVVKLRNEVSLLDFLVVIFLKDLLTLGACLLFLVQDMHNSQMLLVKELLRLFETCLLLFGDVPHELLEVVISIVLAYFI